MNFDWYDLTTGVICAFLFGMIAQAVLGVFEYGEPEPPGCTHKDEVSHVLPGYDGKSIKLVCVNGRLFAYGPKDVHIVEVVR